MTTVGVLQGISLVVGAGFCWSGAGMLRRLRWLQRLPPRSDAGPSPEGAKISVIVAARDEAARLSDTLERILAQRGVDLEVIVVNDRSSDATPRILEDWARRDPRLKAVHVKELPAGWLGKCHACFRGSEAATGDWLLFTDADCWLTEDVVLRAWQAAAREGVDHITLTPGVAPQTVPAQGWHLAFLLGLTDRFEGVWKDHPTAHLGVGAFNFVRRDAYRKCGGYEKLRLTVIDDIRLGLLLRRAGFRTRAYLGGQDAQCHWGVTARSMIGLLEKNYFAAVDYELGLVLAIMVWGLLIWGTALAGLGTGTWAGSAAALSMFLWSIPAGVLARRLGWGLAGAIMTPLSFPMLWFGILHSAWVTLRQGGVRWRDTFYPLAELRKHTVKRRCGSVGSKVRSGDGERGRIRVR